MLKHTPAVILGFLILSASAFAQEAEVTHTTNMHAARKFGLGLGGASYGAGITAKYFLNEGFAVQGFVGSAFGLSFNVGVDALYVAPKLWSNNDFSLNWEAGVGAGSLLWTTPLYSGVAFFGSAVGGLSLQYRPIPLELTADFRPTLSVGSGYPGVFLSFGGGGAIRYYF